jgi:GNAT superfamily N-acetyltransferase
VNVPIVTQEVAWRLEAAEAEYHVAKLRALEADDGNSRGIEIERLGRSILLSIQSRRQNPSYNRAMCFSNGDQEHLDDILCWLRDRADTFWLDVAPALVDGAVLGQLADAGLYPAFFMNVMHVAPCEMEGELPPGVLVEAIDLADRGRDFAVALSEGFGVPAEILDRTQHAVQIEYGTPEWRTYLASIDGHPAAMAALYIRENTASIDAMSTVPRFRNRGCQSALLRRCVRDAARAGCDLLASQTGPSSGSERNMLRAGFRIAYTKALYSPRKDPA